MNLNQITVPSTDVGSAVTFYEKLGMKLIVRALPHYARLELPQGGATFSVHLVDQLPEGEGVLVYFECDHLDTRVTELKDAGISFDELPENKPWLWREARLKDPDGNRLVLYNAGENRKNPPWRIN